MSEQTQNNPQQMIVIGLVVVAVLLAAIVGVLVYQQSTKVPAPTATGTAVTPPAGTAGGTQMPPVTGGTTPAEFDAKTATKVPEGQTPEDLIKAYHQAVIDGKYEEAYKMLPVDKQQSYGDAKAYGDQVKAYGITSYEMQPPVESGDTITISATQVTPQMPIAYTWTFKKVGDTWYVASRTMGGQ